MYRVGQIVKTSYDTGPYRITKVSELCDCPSFFDVLDNRPDIRSRPHYHLTCVRATTEPDKYNIKRQSEYYLNGFDEFGHNVWRDDYLISDDLQMTLNLLALLI